MYFKEKTIAFINDFKEGKNFFIGEAEINPEGIIIAVSKLLKQEKKLIAWHDVGIRKYTTYISVYSKENPLDFNRGYSYKKDWNTFVLYNVINAIITNKNIKND